MQFVDQFKDKLLTCAISQGFDSAEFFYKKRSSRNVKLYQGKVEKYENTSVGGFSFRGLYNGKMGYYYSEALDEAKINDIIENAKENSQLIESDEQEFIYDGKSAEYKELSTYNESISALTLDELVDFTLTAEKTAYEVDSRIAQVLSSNISVGENYISIGNTAGLNLSSKSNYAIAYITCIAEQNNETKENSEIRFYTDKAQFDPVTLAKKAVEKTVSMLGASSTETGVYDVIIKNEAMADLLSCYISNFYGENVQKGFSLLKGKLNEKIADSRITLIDNPHLKDGISTAAFDSEGVPTRINSLIENGVLKTYLHNLKSAAVDGVSPTGNGFKSSFKGTVGISCTNLYIENGTCTDLPARMKNGIIITELSGLHSGTNAVSGDFSLLASGFMVADSKITTPVEQITVAGNFYDLLNKVIDIGDDLNLNTGIGSPSILFSQISIAGK